MSNPESNAVPNHQAILNRIWSQTILEELTRFGVKHVCIAPGSRSTPLTLEAEENTKLTIHTHFDERGLGFLALGIAKASKEPVAIIVTSGTAVANLLPAITESGLTKEKLVVLTADRPTELIGCGANQAINQNGIFSSHVTGALNLPSPAQQIPLNWLLSSVDQQMYQQSEFGGSIHINCPFPEPLYSNESKALLSEYTQSVSNWQLGSCTYIEQQKPNANNQQCLPNLAAKKGLIVVGNVALEEAIKAKQLAECLGWPVLCDPQSGTTSEWAYFDIWLQNKNAADQLDECELIVQVGARLVSKRADAFIKNAVKSGCAQLVLVSESTQRLNPNHLSMTHIAANISDWLIEQIRSVEGVRSQHKHWCDELKQFSETVSSSMEFSTQLSEVELAHKLARIESEHTLFIGNSLIVRLLDMVGKVNQKQVFTNRGASGIDGLVATAVGVQKAENQPLLMLLGDTSLLYDLNSLALAGKCQKPMVIVVTNNDGGAIFDLLPVPQQQKKSLYQMPHGYQFEHAAAQFGLGYNKPSTMTELADMTDKHLKDGKGCLLLEVQTPPEQATLAIKELVSKTINVSH
ncbi:2-succinyl-5-enolpyruvyl-6-hydroxy-3-cyclohexene-1-carboxylic-acid synthase [Vibrio sp. HN007]|uniref:2-succinyl-5-enolpyruvyl-6-hydroxy-3- cyclohexene-1-carboxylic-acid synthase n=1 Tax=Vibrio iocasae TaxID=3098914 RepID=UPI0035D44B79